MSISLKTHTVYPEIQYNEKTKQAVGILYTREGGIAFELKGEAASRKDASNILTGEFAKVANKFLIPKEVTK